MPVSLYAPQLVKLTSLSLRLYGEAYLRIPSALHVHSLSIETRKHMVLVFEDMEGTVDGLNDVTLFWVGPACEGATALMAMLRFRGWTSTTLGSSRNKKSADDGVRLGSRIQAYHARKDVCMRIWNRL